MVTEPIDLEGGSMQVNEETLEMVEPLDGEAPGILGLLVHRLPQSAKRGGDLGNSVETGLEGGFTGQRPKAGEVLPPYASYSSWVRLLEALARSLPSVLDESHLAGLNCASSSIKPLKSALRFFGLVGTANRPTDRLERLVQALRIGGTAKAKALRGMVCQSYHPLLSPDSGLKSATTAELRLYFGTMGARGQIQQKCCSFFLNLARDVGVELPAQLLSRAPVALRRHQIAAATSGKSQPRLRPLDRERKPPASGLTWGSGFLTDLFPRFDIDWPEEKKQRWFKDFATLVKIYEKNEEYQVG